MSFLTVFGLDVPIAAGSFAESVEEVGEGKRAYDGTLRLSRHTGKRLFDFSLVPLEFQEAEAWAGLLRGLGEAWNYDSNHLYGSKGTGPSSSSGATVNAAAAFTGGYGLRLAATTGSIVYPVSYPRGATVLLRRDAASDDTWSHYCVDSTGRKWVAGSRNDAASTSWLTIGATSITLANTSGSTDDYDEIVFLPFLLPTSWPPLLAAVSVPPPELPRLTVRGDVVPDESAAADSFSMLGQLVGGDTVHATLGGAWRTNARVLKCRLAEV